MGCSVVTEYGPAYMAPVGFLPRPTVILIISPPVYLLLNKLVITSLVVKN